jgi:hypothetical protein
MFSAWFIKTKGKQPSLGTWPDFAWYLYVTLQLNTAASSGRSSDANFSKVLPFSMRRDTGEDSDAEIPFMISEWNNSHTRSRAEVTRKANRLVAQGINRPNSKKTPLMGFNRGFGPLLSDLDMMRRRIAQLTQDPRDRQLLHEQFKDTRGSIKMIAKLLEHIEGVKVQLQD